MISWRTILNVVIALVIWQVLDKMFLSEAIDKAVGK